jgi:hypothetical protein
MALLDRMKAGASQAVAKAQEAGKAGQSKLDEIQAKRKLDGLYRDLGAATYADHAGRADSTTASEIQRLFVEIEAHEAENGEGSAEADDDTDEVFAEPGETKEGDTPSGGFKLD